MRRRYKMLIIVLLVPLVIFTGLIVWAETPPSPMQQAINALQSDSNVTVINGQWLTFKPTASNYTTGMIIYPGGRVDYRSYAPLAHAIANEGFLTIIVPMPLNLAVFGANAANDVIKSYPEITSWAIGGHSLGWNHGRAVPPTRTHQKCKASYSVVGISSIRKQPVKIRSAGHYCSRQQRWIGKYSPNTNFAGDASPNNSLC